MFNENRDFSESEVDVARTAGRSAWTRRIVGLAIAAAMIPLGIAFVENTQGHPKRSEDARVASADLRPADRPPTQSPSATDTPATVAGSEDDIRTGPGIDAVGIYLQFGARPDGTLDVTERVVLSLAVNRVEISPPSASAAGPAFVTSRPVVLDLQVEAGGQPVANVPARLSRDLEIPIKQKSVAFTLRYRVSGTLVMSIPSTANRALAFIRPISAGMDAALPVQMLASGPSTLNLTCPQLSPALQACARGTSPKLRVESGVAAAEATVLLQLDLPEP